MLGRMRKNALLLAVLGGLFLKNTTADAVTVLLGYGSSYNVRLFVTTADGHTKNAFDLSALQEHPGGFPSPRYARLEPHATREINYPLSRIILLAGRRDVTLESQIAKGVSVRVLFEGGVAGDIPLSLGADTMWTGKLSSAGLALWP